ncbi:MAG: hypothetical protein JWQ43_3153 [Glaciihabitans sp.]|nr:hypothetical protein [Glaciihabitans sp.]
MRKTMIIGATVGVLAAVGMAAPATAAESTAAKDATVYVLHGVPNTPVDVYVDSVLTIDNFQPGTLTESLKLPRGEYNVSLAAADSTNDDNAILEADVNLHAGRSYTVVAHLDVDGDPGLTLFRNNLGGYDAGQGRLVVRHVAEAPDVDVLAGGKTVFEDLSNGDQISTRLAAGTVEAAVALAGTTAPVIGPAHVEVKANYTTVVYAWGSATDGNLALAVQSIAGEGSGK